MIDNVHDLSVVAENQASADSAHSPFSILQTHPSLTQLAIINFYCHSTKQRQCRISGRVTFFLKTFS